MSIQHLVEEECGHLLGIWKPSLVMTITVWSEGSLGFGFVWINLHARALITPLHIYIGNYNIENFSHLTHFIVLDNES